MATHNFVPSQVIEDGLKQLKDNQNQQTAQQSFTGYMQHTGVTLGYVPNATVTGLGYPSYLPNTTIPNYTSPNLLDWYSTAYHSAKPVNHTAEIAALKADIEATQKKMAAQSIVIEMLLEKLDRTLKLIDKSDTKQEDKFPLNAYKHHLGE